MKKSSPSPSPSNPEKKDATPHEVALPSPDPRILSDVTMGPDFSLFAKKPKTIKHVKKQ